MVVRGGRRRPRPAPRARGPSTSSPSASTATARRSPPVDERGEATRPAITFLDTRAAAEAAELAAATGIRGWALGPLPAALWLERHEPEAAARDALVPHDLGVAGVPADRRGRRAARARPGRPRPGASSHAATGLRMDRRPPDGAHGRRRRRPDRRRPPMRSGCVPGSRSPAARTTPSRATSARASSSRATPTTRAARPAGSACTGTSRSRSPGAFVTPAPLDGLYSVGAAMAATGRALDWFRDDDRRRRRLTTERLLEEAAATPPGADGLVFLPYLAGERSPIWDPTATGVLRRPDPGPRPRPPRPGDPRGERPRHPPRRDADARGRRPVDGDARLRRPGPERRLEPGQGRRHRLPGARPGRARDRGPRLGDPRRGRRSGRTATSRRRSGR